MPSQADIEAMRFLQSQGGNAASSADEAAMQFLQGRQPWTASPAEAGKQLFPETPYGAVNPKSPLYRAAAWLEDRVKPGIMQVINTMGVPLGMGEELTKGFHPGVRAAFPGPARYTLGAYQAITHPGALGEAWNTIRERGARNEPPPSPMEYWGQKMPEHPWLAAGIGFAESVAMDPFSYVSKGPLAVARLGQGRAVTRSAAIAQGIAAEAGAQFGEQVGARLGQASRGLAEEATKWAYQRARTGWNPARLEQAGQQLLYRDFRNLTPEFQQAANQLVDGMAASGIPTAQAVAFRNQAIQAAMGVAAKSAAEDMRPMWGFGVSAEKMIPTLPATGGGEAMWRGARGAIEARRPRLAPDLDRMQDAYSRAYRAFNMGSRGTPVERMQGERIRQFQAAETQRQATSAEEMTRLQSARTGQEAAHFIGAAKAYQYGKVADFQGEVMAAGALYDPNAAPMFAQRYGFTQRDLQALEPMASGIAAEVRAGKTIEQTRIGSPAVRQAVASVEDAARNAPDEAQAFKIIRDAVWKGTQEQVAYRKLQLAAIAQTDDILGGLGGPWGPLNRASKARAVMEQAGLDARQFKRALLREDDLGLVEAGRYDEILDDLTNNITVTKWDRASKSFKPVPVMAAMKQSVEDYREWMAKLGDDATMRGMLESMTDEEVNAYMHGAAPSAAMETNMERAIKRQIDLALMRSTMGKEKLLVRTDNLYQLIKTIPKTLEKRFRDARAAQIASAEAVVKLEAKAEGAGYRAAHKARVQAGLETVRDAAALQRQEQLGALGQQYDALRQAEAKVHQAQKGLYRTASATAIKEAELAQRIRGELEAMSGMKPSELTPEAQATIRRPIQERFNAAMQQFSQETGVDFRSANGQELLRTARDYSESLQGPAVGRRDVVPAVYNLAKRLSDTFDAIAKQAATESKESFKAATIGARQGYREALGQLREAQRATLAQVTKGRAALANARARTFTMEMIYGPRTEAAAKELKAQHVGAQRQVINLEQQAGRAAVKQASRKQMLAEQKGLREGLPRRMAEAEDVIREARPAPTAAERDAIAYMWTQLDSVDQEFLADDLKTWLSTQGVDMPKGWVIPESDVFLGMQGPRPSWSKEQTFSHPIRAAWSGLRRNLDFFSAMWMRDKAQNRAIMRQDMGSYLQGIGIPEEMARQSAEFQHYVPLEVAARTAGVQDVKAVYRVWPEFRGMRFHPDVANGIVRHMVAPWTKYPFLTSLGDMYLKYLRSWKAGATVASPVWAMVNVMGNVYNSALRGLTNPVRYLEGAAISTGNEKPANAYAAAASRIPGSIIKRAGDRWVIETWQGTMDLAQAHQFAIEHGVFSGWTSSELSRMSPSKVNQFMDISNRVGNPFSPDFYGYWGTKRFGRWTEDVSRNALFWDQIAKGHMAEESSQIVAATLFDYSSLTREEKAIRNFGAPFYTWMKNNLKYQLQMLMEHPGWAAAMPRAMENSRYLIPEEQRVPGGLIPQYLSDTLSVQAGHDEQGRPIFWTVRLPVFDLVRLSTIREILSAAGPMKLLPEVMTNYSFFYGRPIDYARPEGTTWVKAPWWVPLKTNWGNRVIKNPKTGELMIDKTTLYELENAFPALAKATQAGVYSTPNGQEVSTVRVWGWSIPTKTLRYTGIRPTPVDLRQQVKRLRRERTMEIQRARSRYRQTSSLPPQAE